MHETRFRDRGRGLGLLLAVAAAGSGLLPAQCPPQWSGAFGFPGTNGVVSSMAVFDDGSGPALHAAGSFTSAGGLPFANLARLTASGWSSSPAIAAATSLALKSKIVFDGGGGPATWFAGSFPSGPGGAVEHRVARWNGSNWVFLGAAFDAAVRALAVFDGGTGPRLHAAGDFLAAGGVSARGVAWWDGTSWAPAGAGLSTGAAGAPRVNTLAVHDDGTGTALYAGGSFDQAGGSPAPFVARWNGAAWSALAGAPLCCEVGKLLSWDDGSTGNALFACGRNIGSSGGAAIARWNGFQWATFGYSGEAWDLLVCDSGSGPTLHAAWNVLPWASDYCVQRWNGSSWDSLGERFFLYSPSGGWAIPRCLAVFDDGSGPSLYVSGSFSRVGSTYLGGIARWNGQAWVGVDALNGAYPGTPRAAAVFDDGTEPALVVDGWAPYGGPGGGLRRYDGTAWTPFPGALPNFASTLVVLDDGSGPALYAGIHSVLRWDGAGWLPVGGPLSVTNSYAVRALAVYDGSLYAGGDFTVSGGSRSLARLQGNAWSNAGVSLTQQSFDPQDTGFVTSLCVHDDGSGPRLFAAGRFNRADGLPAAHIVAFDTVGWSEVDQGLTLSSAWRAAVLGLASIESGPLAGLYACGEFVAAGGQTALSLARWDGIAWSAVGSASSPPPPGGVQSLTVFDDGFSAHLFAGGHFPNLANPFPTSGIARWDGMSWSSLGPGIQGSPSLLVPMDRAGRSSLFALGNFASAGGLHSVGIAAWEFARPVLRLSQPQGSGTGVVVTNDGLIPGSECFNVFSLDLCPTPATGPYLGLCAADPAFLLAQVLAPAGAGPFHFFAPAPVAQFGPYLLPAGLSVEGFCLDASGGVLRCRSPIHRYDVQ